MKKNSLLLTLMTCVVTVGLTLTSCSTSNPEAEAAALRANDIADCQNLMSAHAWYHSAFLNNIEIEKLWVSPDGEYASTAVWAQNTMYWIGLDNIKGYYGPSVDVEFTKSQFQMHTITTGVVQIAEDRKTAKGVWYTPGIIGVANGLRGIWERYGIDFVRENGEWKIWHCHVYTDFTIEAVQGAAMGPQPSGEEGPQGAPGMPPGPPPTNTGGQAEQIGSAVETSAGGPGGMGAKPSVTVENGYKELSHDTYPFLIPRLPEPYKTFSETWSFGDPREMEMFSGPYREWSEIKAEYENK